MTKTDEHGPDNPRAWDPNHPLLKSTGAPHETNGVMRAHRAGRTGKELVQILKLKPLALSKALSRAMDEENEAAKRGRDIHDAVFNRRPRS
ncbi:hypothetical protein SEA_SORORFAGO_72 [Mycobacterium phage SororFago]|nr:hypothetical protein SEA_SORORFAGO_72 [Mycobacterium phage SororFago]